MNNLVSYDSSDEDDEAIVEVAKVIASPPPKNGAADVPHPEDQAQAQAQAQVKTNQGPALGPSLAPDGMQGYEGYDDEAGDDSYAKMTERDTIRYLTQPSHPMTEMLPSPPGSPDPSAGSRFRRFLDLKVKGMHFNQDLAQKSGFKNPSLLYTLMQRAGLERDSEHRTSLPLDVLDPHSFPAAAFKEELLRSQQTVRAKYEAEQKSLSVAGKRSLEFTSAGTSEVSKRVSAAAGIQKRQKQ